ncbi:unnamed protein product [Schistosoma spindalis]|nr:unnamed protein product [Schistosoma spindale]
MPASNLFEFRFVLDTVVATLSVRVRKWEEIIERTEVVESLKPLETYCKNVVNVVKELEPKLKSATLSCDIDQSQRPKSVHTDTINVQLAVLSSEMEEVFSSKTWFPSLKNTLESGVVSVNSAWLTDGLIKSNEINTVLVCSKLNNTLEPHSVILTQNA